MGSKYYYQRTNIEAAIIYKHFQGFKLFGSKEKFFLGGYTTKTKQRHYKIKLTLPLGYPDQKPELNVTHPKRLLKRNCIDEIDSFSHDFHTIGKNSDGYMTICHYTSDDWHAARTCLWVLFKALLWLESYEIYLDTGDSIDVTLKKIQKSLALNNKLIRKKQNIININELLMNIPDYLK